MPLPPFTRRYLLLISLSAPLSRQDSPAAAQPGPPTRWSLHTGLLVSRLRYAAGRQRTGAAESGTDYTLGDHPAQLGGVVGANLAIAVPPTGTNTFLLLSLRAVYNRRQLTVHADPYAPTPPVPPAYDARFRYRTVDAQIGLGVRHLLAPRRHLFWEAGPVLALTCQDYSRLDSDAGANRYLQAPGSNVLLRGALGWQPTARWQVTAAYARGLVKRRTQVVTGEDYAELTLHYALSAQ